MRDFVVTCPHCHEYVLIEEINCAIFRHGVLKDGLNQMNPHTPKGLCDSLVSRQEIYGCGKPFRLVQDKNGLYTAVICDYI